MKRPSKEQVDRALMCVAAPEAGQWSETDRVLAAEVIALQDQLGRADGVVRSQRAAIDATSDVVGALEQLESLIFRWETGGMKRGETRVSLVRCAKELRSLLAPKRVRESAP